MRDHQEYSDGVLWARAICKRLQRPHGLRPSVCRGHGLAVPVVWVSPHHLLEHTGCFHADGALLDQI